MAVVGGQFVYWLQVGWWKPLTLLDLWTALQMPRIHTRSLVSEVMVGWLLDCPV